MGGASVDDQLPRPPKQLRQDRQGRQPTGFPSPAEDHLEPDLDLHEFVVQNPAATFFMAMEGLAMRDAGILPGDIVVVDRSLTPLPGDIVVVAVEGELLVRQFHPLMNGVDLVPAHPDYEVVRIRALTEHTLWGVVTYTLHSHSSEQLHRHQP